MAMNALFTSDGIAFAASVGATVSVVGVLSIIVLYLMKFVEERNAVRYPYRPLPRSVAKPHKKKAGGQIDGGGFMSYFLDLNIKAHKPVAIFDRKFAPGGKFEFKLAREYGRGENVQANEILNEHDMTMRQIEEKTKRICEMLLNEPNGKFVERIVIGSMPEANLQFHKYLNVLIFNMTLLDNPELMQILFVPHEAYHVAQVEGGIEIEETLVHALGFLRVVNTYRAGKTDPAARRLFERAMGQMNILEIERKGTN